MGLEAQLLLPASPHGTAALRLYCREQRSRAQLPPGVALAENAGLEKGFRRSLASE